MSALQSEAAALPGLPFTPPAPRSAPEEITIRVDGIFDGATAWELRNMLDKHLAGSSTIVLDFSKVREFYDFGVSVLAYWLAQRPNVLPRVLLRGLRTHQLRMFRYFGVDADGRDPSAHVGLQQPEAAEPNA